MEGVRFGVVVALVVIGFGVIWQYVTFPDQRRMAVAGVIDAIVELAIYGAIVGAIYEACWRRRRAQGRSNHK